MKTLVQIAVASTAMLGYATAHAQAALPSSNSADLFLFVENTSTKQTFIEDTGISVGSLMPSGSLLPSGSSAVNTSTISSTINDSINLANTSALNSFLTAAGTNVQWTVEAAQFSGTAANGNDKVTGSSFGIDANNNSAALNAKLSVGNFNLWLGGLDSDVGVYNSNGLNAGTAGAVALATSTPAWGAVTGGGGGSTDEYGQGPDSAGIGLNTAVNLYGYTGNGNTSTLQSYLLGQLELTFASGTGSLETLGGGGGSSVPLPAAVWLFGSGLLGLAGIGRRRSQAAVAA